MKEIRATNNPRIAIAGCVNSSVQTLKKLNEHSLNVVRVLSLNPDKSKNVSGYHDLTELGEKWNYPTTYFEKINDENIISLLREDEIDWLFIIGLSQLIKEELLNVARYGNIGFHPTALPKGRGRGAIAWIILGEAPAAATFFILDQGMDSGDLISQVAIEVSDQDYAFDLIEKIKSAIDTALDLFLPKLKLGTLSVRPQIQKEASFLGQRKPKDGLINWEHPAEEVLRLIRATSSPLPGAFSFFNEKKIVIYKAKVRKEFTGVPGRIIHIDLEGRPVVACKQGGILLLQTDVEISLNFKIGNDFQNNL